MEPERGRARERYYWRDGREEGRRKGGKPGEWARLGKIETFPLFAWEKKKGGRKGGRAERRWLSRASAKAKTREKGSQKEEV